jgi:hypothetical protein
VLAEPVEQAPPPETGPVPVRRFGTSPAGAILWLAVAVGSAAVVLLALGAWVVGLILLVVALVLGGFYVARARGPETSFALTRVRARSRAVAVAVAAQAQAQAEQLQLRRDLQRLAAERGERLRALGEAVYREDAAGTEAARAALRELDEAVAAKEAEMTQIALRAQERAGQARLEAQSTFLLEPAEPTPGPVPEPYPPPDEGTPPTPAPIPEPYPPPDEGDPPRQP